MQTHLPCGYRSAQQWKLIFTQVMVSQDPCVKDYRAMSSQRTSGNQSASESSENCGILDKELVIFKLCCPIIFNPATFPLLHWIPYSYDLRDFQVSAESVKSREKGSTLDWNDRVVIMAARSLRGWRGSSPPRYPAGSTQSTCGTAAVWWELRPRKERLWRAVSLS